MRITIPPLAVVVTSRVRITELLNPKRGATHVPRRPQFDCFVYRLIEQDLIVLAASV